MVSSITSPSLKAPAYKEKCVSAQEAMSHIKSGDKVFIHANAAHPQTLVQAMTARSKELSGVEIFELLCLGEAPYAREEYKNSFRVHSLFIGSNVRDAVNKGRGDYIPVFLSEIPSLFLSGQIPLDVCLVQVSPPDSHGYCSFGVGIDCVVAARKASKLVIAEVNEQMPRTLGRSFVHFSKFDYIVETSRPLPELPVCVPDEIDNQIAANVCDLVEDGATLQMGIGSIPDAVIRFLKDRHNLGIHTEMFSDGVLDLIELGVITNDAKKILPGKTATSFVMGSKRLYDFVDNNPSVEFQTSDFINDPFIIAQNDKVVAINSALQIDLTGQVCADSLGTRLYSGFGGQVDFIRGAARSKGGKPIIALPSTAKDGMVSRIMPHLSQGGGVVTSRGDVHFVVTEFGVAQLHGKNLKDRAKALIAISHPKFQSYLEEECRKISWLN